MNPMTKHRRVELGDSYKELLLDHQPELFLTLTLEYNYSDRLAEGALKAFVYKLLNRLPKRVRPHVYGIVTAERHIEVAREGLYHFHILLWGIEAHMEDALSWFDREVKRAASEIYPRVPGPLCDCGKRSRGQTRTCRGGLSCRGPAMTSAKNVNAQLVHTTPHRLHTYCVMDIYRYDTPNGGQVATISPAGVDTSFLTRNLI